MKRRAPAPAPLTAVVEQTPPAPPAPLQATRLVQLHVSTNDWLALNPVTRRMLRVPLGWRTHKDLTLSVPLRWKIVADGRRTWIIEGSAPAVELAGVLAAAGAVARTEVFRHPVRRIPAGAVLTDPKGKGDRTEVELTGAPLLMRDRRGRWRRCEMAGTRWPDDAQEILADHVPGVEGWSPAPTSAPARFGVEEGVADSGRRGGTSYRWHRRSAWLALADAGAEMERAAIADARVARSSRWRVVDIGTGAVLGVTRLRKGALVRLDFAPGLKSAPRPKPAKVAVPPLGAP